MSKDFNVKFGNISDAMAADIDKLWRFDVRETHTLSAAVGAPDATITLGQTSTVKAGDAILIDDEVMYATSAPGGENQSVIPVQRTAPAAHANGATANVLLYKTPFEPLGPLTQDYILGRMRDIRDISAVLHVEVSGTISESAS
ncbi:MAG TPA: hypothetical protein VGM43_12730 [Bryobacteraceae bacterium]|jgi:hypothetical protein